MCCVCIFCKNYKVDGVKNVQSLPPFQMLCVSVLMFYVQMCLHLCGFVCLLMVCDGLRSTALW